MTLHHLEIGRASLHGRFNATLTPALHVVPGDTVIARTLDVSWGHGQHVRGALTRPKFEPREAPRDSGPAMTGPIAVEGAEPGMTLAVHIEALRPGDYGWTYAGRSPFDPGYATRLLGDDYFAKPNLMLWDIDADAGRARNEDGFELALDPFLGTCGVCPQGDGWHEGWLPSRFGGNMDCRATTVGTTLYLPVGVPGALLSFGDGHARQGDGEICGTAIECMMQEVRLRIDLIEEGPSLKGPVVRGPDTWTTLGFGRDLDDAITHALDSMLDILARELSLSRERAWLLASTMVDVRLTQLVNGVRGVHALWKPADVVRHS